MFKLANHKYQKTFLFDSINFFSSGFLLAFKLLLSDGQMRKLYFTTYCMFEVRIYQIGIFSLGGVNEITQA